MKRFGLRLVLKVSGFGKVGTSLLERRTVTSSYHRSNDDVDANGKKAIGLY